MDNSVSIFTANGRINVSGTDGEDVTVYDMMGRIVSKTTEQTAIPIAAAGVYIVKVGILPVQKVVVVK